VSWAVRNDANAANDANDAKVTLKKDTTRVSVSQGGVAFVPIKFKAPVVAGKTVLKLSADCKYKDGKEIRSDEMELRVFPKTDWKWGGEPVLLVDSSGKTEKVLAQMGVGFTKLSAEDSAAQSNADAIGKARLVVVGKNSYPDAVKVFSKAPVLDAVRNGLNLVVLEQMNRHVMGLKLENTSSRDVYVRSPDSPLLAGLDDRDFANWRSESQMLPSYPSFDAQSLWWWQGYSYQGQFNKWRQRRAWHWSNKAMVATFCAEKPQFGNFRVLLDAGFDLLYTPLVEFQAGKGRVLLNQLDLVDHYGIDPVATMLLQRILDEYSRPAARKLTPVAVVSDAGAAALKDLRMQSKRGLDGQVAFLLPDDLDKQDARQTEELRNFVQNGGSVVTSVKTTEQAAKLPIKLTLEARKAFNPTFPADPAFSGLGISDLFLREMHDFQAVTKAEGAKAALSPMGIAGTVEFGKGRIVLLQLPPDKFKGAEAFWGRSKVIRTYSAILGNLGGKSEVELDPLAIGGWGIPEEWLPGYDERVPKKAPKLKESNVYEKPALDWDPDSHVCW
jgi:beta-galactosidase